VIKAMKNVSEEDKEKVLGTNAMRLFGMNESGVGTHTPLR
jgi:hypothetical protein